MINGLIGRITTLGQDNNGKNGNHNGQKKNGNNGKIKDAKNGRSAGERKKNGWTKNLKISLMNLSEKLSHKLLSKSLKF